VELTEIAASPDGDATVPAFDMAVWQEIARESHAAQGSAPAYDFVTLLRRVAT
jgi:dihydrofolate reductase